MSLTPKKSLGQNFLRDPNTIRKIVDALAAPVEAHVVEIGPGEGALTHLLHAKYPHFTAIEVDERAVHLLKTAMPNLDVRHQDVLAVDWGAFAAEAGRPLYVIGNLPYYITSPILFSLLDAPPVIKEALVMMQLEVAQRIVAVPRTKAYGILSVLVQQWAEPSLAFRVSRNVFYPKPDVESAMLRVRFPEGVDPMDGVDREDFRHVVRMAFNQRRKTLRNSLKPLLKTHEIDLPEPWRKVRAEELSPSDFLALTRYLAAAS